MSKTERLLAVARSICLAARCGPANRHLEAAAEALSLTARQYAVLAAVATATGSTKNTWAKNRYGRRHDERCRSPACPARDFSSGIVVRTSAIHVRLTAIGEQVLASSDKIAKEFDNRILELIPLKSRPTLMRALRMMAEHAEAEPPAGYWPHEDCRPRNEKSAA